MDFRVGEDQRELAEGIRAMVAGRLPLERLRAREGASGRSPPTTGPRWARRACSR